MVSHKRIFIKGLYSYIYNSSLFTVLLSIIIGVTLAWLISAYDFPFRKFLDGL